jgi:pyruvate,water dikinase
MRRLKTTCFGKVLERTPDVLVTDKTDPDWAPTMKKAVAIATNRGSRTCHAAIVSRELGLPAVVGTETGTDVLKTRQIVTVSCAEGESEFVYEGEAPFKVQRVDLTKLNRPKTKSMMNLGKGGNRAAVRFQDERVRESHWRPAI